MLRNALAAFSAAAILLSAGCATTTESYEPYGGYAVSSAPPHTVTSVYVFEEVLTPWGQWLYLDGVRVWRPYASVVGNDFVPYATGGRWTYTDYGWTFDSRWDWGWATFHYGWWVLSPVYGWVWVPGTQWAPAWVIWRHGGGYIGWAPFAPTFAFGHYDPFWMFVDTGYFVHYDVYRYCVPRSRVPRLWAATTPIRPIARGTTRVIGPPPGEVREVVGRIPRAEIIPPPEGVIARPRIVAEAPVRWPRVEPAPQIGGSGPVGVPTRPTPEIDRPEIAAPARPVPEINRPEIDRPAPAPAPAPAPVRPVPEIDRPAPAMPAPVRPVPEIDRPTPAAPAPVRPAPQLERPSPPAPTTPPPPTPPPAPAAPAPATPAAAAEPPPRATSARSTPQIQSTPPPALRPVAPAER